jgi:uncharacterized RDD family membrane protein YckC
MEIFVAKAGRESGPFTKEQVNSMLDSALIGLEDSTWHEGLSEWIPVYQLLSLRPPVPGPAALPQTTYTLPAPAHRSGDFASFGIRVMAHLIDSLVCFAAVSIAGFIFLTTFFADVAVSDEDYNEMFTPVSITIAWLYFALMESSGKQATLGKIACGLVVSDMQGRRISFGRASGRFAGMFISALVLGIGYLMCGWSARKQCLHDKMAECLVLWK